MATPVIDRKLEATAKITSKGQITVPVEIRNALEVKVGDQLQFVLRKHWIILPLKALILQMPI